MEQRPHRRLQRRQHVSLKARRVGAQRSLRRRRQRLHRPPRGHVWCTPRQSTAPRRTPAIPSRRFLTTGPWHSPRTRPWRSPSTPPRHLCRRRHQRRRHCRRRRLIAHDKQHVNQIRRRRRIRGRATRNSCRQGSRRGRHRPRRAQIHLPLRSPAFFPSRPPARRRHKPRRAATRRWRCGKRQW